MPQELVNFRATIIDATAMPERDISTITEADEIAEEISTLNEISRGEIVPPPPTPKFDCCESPTLKIEKEADELADALPMILMGVGIAYLIGVYTGASIFSYPVEG
jgi:hypothetical protein